MLNAGISLPDCLVYLEKGETNPALRQVLGGCLSTLIRGHSLSAGLKKYPEVFNLLTTEMVANGEHTGALAQTLGHLATLQERSLDRARQVKSAMAYPFCLLLVMLAVVGLFVVFVAPGDQGLFAALGDDIPWPSRVLIEASAILTSPVLLLVSCTLISGSVLLFRRAYFENTEFRLKLDDACLRVPVLGKLLIRLETARTLDVLASSLRVGLSIVQALKNAIRVARNERYRKDLLAASQAIMNGDGLGVALARNTGMPRFATSLIEVAEEAGELDRALERTAKILDDDVNDALSAAVALAEPLLLCVGGLAAGFVAVATFLPVMRLISNL